MSIKAFFQEIKQVQLEISLNFVQRVKALGTQTNFFLLMAK